MPWNSVAPLGSVSVKANRTILGDNTTYIETTMGKLVLGTNTVTTRDHFWAVSSDLDGRHRFIQSIGFTSSAAIPNDVYPVLGTGMQTVLFPLVTNGEVQWFHKNQDNNDKIYQFIPNFLTGTKQVDASYNNVIDVPANCYGEIFMWRTTQGNHTAQVGFFRSNATVVEAWAYALAPDGQSERAILKFANGSVAVDLNIRARTENATAGNTWNYRITYRAI